MSNKSYFHRGGEVPLLGVTIPDHFAAIAARYPNNEAVVSIPEHRSLSYAELASVIKRLAKGLVALGFGKGDRIGIWSTNNLQWVVLQMATAEIGAVLVNINPAYRQTELEYVLKTSELQALFLIPAFKSSNYSELISAAVPELADAPADNFRSEAFPWLRRIVLYDPSEPETMHRPAPGFTLWSECIAAAEQTSDRQLETMTANLDIDDPINIQYTSGTTGFPKAVVLTHHNILNNAFFSAQAMHFGSRDRLCIPVPFYHCFGMVLANLLCFSVGATAVIACEHFEAEAVLQAIEQQHCTAVHGVPTMFIAELEHPDFDRFALDTLRTGIMAGAPCPPELMKRVIRDMHCQEILIGYGETEASPLTHLTTREDSLARRTETVGHNLPHQEVKIISTDDGRTVPLGEIGEICFRGYHIMRGYYGNEAATAKAIDTQGWLHSGDLGSMDQDGYLTITGRLKDMVIRGGENIYPQEIENFLYNHPKVAAVAVFGIPDDFYGEQLVAWLQLRAGEQCSEEEIQKFCYGKIAYYKIPKIIRFVESFPMTITGKLQKYRMREMMLEQLKC